MINPAFFEVLAYLSNVALALVGVSLIAVFIASTVTKASETNFRRHKNRLQRDKNERNIAFIEIELRRLQERVDSMEKDAL